MANFPAGPLNGAITTVNGIVYVYDDTKTAWKRSTSFGGNLTILGNITSANVITGNVYTSGGIYWSNNGAAYSSGGGGGGSSNFLYTASATAPGSPSRGDQWFDTGDGTLYEYIDDGDSLQWIDIQSPTFLSNAAVTSLSGNVITNGNISASSIIITSGIFWSNGTAFASSIYSNANVEAYIGANLGAFQTFSNANAATQTSSINTINANLGSFQTYANTKIGTNTNSNLVVVATTTSTSATTGALVVRGGAGVAGNVYTDRVYTTAGIYWSGNGASFSSGGGSPFASNVVITSGTAGTSATSGALVVTGTGGLGVGGTSYFNSAVTIASSSLTTNTTTGALIVTGGVGIGGDVIAGGFLQSISGITSTSSGTGAITTQGSGGIGVGGNLYVGNELVVPGGGKMTSGGLAYLLEKVTVTASAPAASFDINLATQSVYYWTGNATANVTANIRGTATQPLNSLLATGQSLTAVLFLPNGPSNFLVANVKIDNTTVAAAYQGNAAPVLGNSNSIDIYSFTILKTADATYKVFASQTQFMHPG